MIENIITPLTIISILAIVSTFILYFVNPKFALFGIVVLIISILLRPAVLNILTTHPLISLSIVGLAIIPLSIYFKKLEYILSGLGLFTIGITFDYFSPPFSSVCFAKSGEELIGLSQQPLSNFAIDTFFCKLYVTHLPNFDILALSSNFTFIKIFVPPIIILLAILGVLSFLYKKFLVPFFFTLMYAIIMIYLFYNMPLGTLYITMATVFGYILIPVILALVGFTLLSVTKNSGVS